MPIIPGNAIKLISHINMYKHDFIYQKLPDRCDIVYLFLMEISTDVHN